MDTDKTLRAQDDYWQSRWERGETGWHQLEVEPRLIEHFSGLTPRTILVPLCGKSLDLIWLLEQGHDVSGVEFAPQPCREFFEENKIPVQEIRKDSFTLFKSEHISIFNGDFLDLPPFDVSIGAVYDRAALIALPPGLRARYARQMLKLIAEPSRSEHFRFLQLVLERNPADQKGPPFSVDLPEIKRLYGADFQISELSRERVEQNSPSESTTEECVYDLRRKRS